MRLICLLFTASLVAAPAYAQGTAASSVKDSDGDLPVSLERIKEGLQQTPTLTFRTLDERPTFRVQILERQRIDELLATLNFKAGPVPAGGVYWNELQRVMFPDQANPVRTPLIAFSGGELITLIVENIARALLGEKAMNKLSNMGRDRAESAAKEEVRQAIRDYCAAQPNNGAGIQICVSSAPVLVGR